MFVPVRPMTINMNLRQRGCVGDMDSQLLDRRRGGPSFEWEWPVCGEM